jgi:ATP-dependent RNA helicase DDX31/DBP7
MELNISVNISSISQRPQPAASNSKHKEFRERYRQPKSKAKPSAPVSQHPDQKHAASKQPRDKGVATDPNNKKSLKTSSHDTAQNTAKTNATQATDQATAKKPTAAKTTTAETTTAKTTAVEATESSKAAANMQQNPRSEKKLARKPQEKKPRLDQSAPKPPKTEATVSEQPEAIKAPEREPTTSTTSAAPPRLKAKTTAKVATPSVHEPKVEEQQQSSTVASVTQAAPTFAAPSGGGGNGSGGFGGGSRKNPAPSSDGGFMHHHLNAAALSTGSLLVPLASSASDDIFKSNQGAGSSSTPQKSSFQELGIHSRLVTLLKAPRAEGGLGLEKPTRVQAVSIAPILAGHNTFIKSQTGSGKTLAYLLPLVHRLSQLPDKISRQDGTFALILAPTRELCSQIEAVLCRLLQSYIWLVPGIISGGEKKKSEKSRLRKGVTMLVATPGRLLDHLKTTEAFRIDRLQYLIIDEVDRLLDLGFESQVKDILQLVASGRRTNSPLQTTLASATVTDAVRTLLREQLGEHLYVDADEGHNNTTTNNSSNGGAAAAITGEKGKDGSTVASEEEEESSSISTVLNFNIPKQLVQHSMQVTFKLRLPALCSVLRNCWKEKKKVMLFVSTTASVDFHTALFGGAEWPGDKNSTAGVHPPIVVPPQTAVLFHGWPLHRLHGNIPQQERQATFKAFRPLKSGLLVRRMLL